MGRFFLDWIQWFRRQALSEQLLTLFSFKKILVLLHCLLLEFVQVQFPAQSLVRDDQNYYQVESDQERRHSDDRVSDLLSRFRLPHQIMQENKVVLDHHEDDFIGNFQSLTAWCFEKSCVAQVNYVPHGEVNRHLDLYPRLGR